MAAGSKIQTQSLQYRKNSKNWDTRNKCHNCPTIGTVGFYSAVLCSKDADRITNREDPDQTAPWGAVWSGSALFAQTYPSQYLKLLRYISYYWIIAIHQLLLGYFFLCYYRYQSTNIGEKIIFCNEKIKCSNSYTEYHFRVHTFL